ncbi:hypothetical protein CUJ83_10960 [Methanocella sp. CWC-04]|uniref:Uncharacterized protein n=1 Tax=Methanooceanicella nereidis TaxID=2052831 RepID=A0AAP2RDE3_9EURY|nr:hypothetical protein [Methanocella sp. CWC-04]MCD1295519.1 hypothetical protein [Methanocella sp. CWC-04]
MSEFDFIKRHWYKAALLLILLIALWYRMGIIESFIIPTYGNTMYHVGIERETILTQHYPDYELSYGGGFPHFYVPAYRLLIVSMSIASGIDPMIMSGIMTITIALFILLAMYILAYKLSNNLYIALFAAFFFVISPEMTIFTMRPLPELLGLFMVPLTFYFVMKENWSMATVGAALTALTHQMTLLSLVAVIALYGVFQLAYAAYKKKDFVKGIKCFIPVVAACATYGLWQVYSLGTLNIFNIAQVVNREGNPVDMGLFLRTGLFVLVFFVLGLLYIYLNSRAGSDKVAGKKPYLPDINIDTKLMIAAWLIATVILSKNDLFGISIFMDRFFTFFVQAAIIIAGFGMYALLSWMGLDLLKEKPEI